MKKKFMLITIISLLFLTGCQMSLVPANKGAVLNYVQSNAQVLKASNEVDKKMITKIKELKEENVNYKNVIDNLYQTRKTQQGMYDVIKNEKAPYKQEKIKYNYLRIINERIVSYDTLIRAAQEEDFNSLQFSIEKHEIKDKELQEKSLIEINYVIEKLKLGTMIGLVPNDCDGKLIEKIEENEEEKKEENKEEGANKEDLNEKENKECANDNQNNQEKDVNKEVNQEELNEEQVVEEQQP